MCQVEGVTSISDVLEGKSTSNTSRLDLSINILDVQILNISEYDTEKKDGYKDALKKTVWIMCQEVYMFGKSL